MTAMTAGFLARTMASRGYEVQPGPDVPLVDGVADSRMVTPGVLWAAFRGETLDGNDFIEDALARGAAAIVCERPPRIDHPGATVVVAPDSRKALGELAQAWLAECRPKVVGITGTVGKTTAKELTAATLAARFAVHRSKENFNSLEGLPLSLVALEPGHEVAVLELAMDRPGEIRELCELVRPDIGVVLNIGLTHASKLGSIEAIAEEKLSLPRWLDERGTAVLNTDDPRVAAVGPLRCRVLTFGRAIDASVRATSVQARGLAGTDFSVLVDGRELRGHTPVPGEHTLPAALCGISVALACGMDAADAVDALGDSGYAGRMVQRPGRNGAVLLDDRYNSSPASLEGALRLLAATPGRRIALLGAMAELGDAEAAEHCRAGSVAAECCDILAASGEPARGLVEAARKAGLQSARWFQDREEAASWIQGQLRAGDHVLIKASRSQAFERVIPLLEAER